MRKFLSLAVMCSLALPAMAFAQPESPKVAADDLEDMPEVEVETTTTEKSVTVEEETTTLVVEGEDGAPDTMVTVVEEKTTVVEEVEEVAYGGALPSLFEE